MIPDLHATLRKLLKEKAPEGSLLRREGEDNAVEISFDLPNADWRSTLDRLKLNCYLYDISENLTLRTHEPLIQRKGTLGQAARRRPPVRIDCAYCITAWSTAGAGVFETEGGMAGALTGAIQEEHQLLSEVLRVLLLHPTIPPDVLHGSLVGQIPPYPTVIASQDGIKNQPDFWSTLDQPVKPSLNYVVTMAMMLEQEPEELDWAVAEVNVDAGHMAELE